MAWMGMNVGRCESHSTHLGAQLKAIKQLLTDLDTEVANIDKNWNGNDSTQFVNDWRGKYRAMLVNAEQLLTRMKKQLDQEIAEQKRTSA